MYSRVDENIMIKNNIQTNTNYGSISFTGMGDETGDGTGIGGGTGGGTGGTGGTGGCGVVIAGETEEQRRSSASDRRTVHFVNGGDRTALNRCDDRWPATASNAAAVLLAVAIVWYLLRVNISPGLMAVPGGSVASMFVLYVAGAAAGRAAGLVEGLPPLLGMMLAGIGLQNCGLYTVTDEWCIQLVAIMREAALSVILIKGGLELNANQLRKLSGAVTRLALLPCIAEAIAAGIAVHFILPNFSWEWGLTLGFTLSAVSPAVLVPSLLRLKRLGYGEENGVNTLMIAASSLDDILSISAFGVLLGIIFSTGNLTSKIVQGPEDICIGTALGIAWGFLLMFVPPSPWAQIYNYHGDNDQKQKEKKVEQSITAKRSILLGVGGFLAVTGSQHYGYPGAGPLACIISSFVAGTGWKWREKNQNCFELTTSPYEEETVENPVEKVFENVWFCFQPVLFASIGTEIKFELLKGGDIVIAGVLVLCAGLVIRVIVTALSILGTGLNRNEITFIQIAWLPKATVQAALAPVALDMARRMGSKNDQECASQLLTIAVISILLTAPIGALGIQLFGPRLLSKSSR